MGNILEYVLRKIQRLEKHGTLIGLREVSNCAFFFKRLHRNSGSYLCVMSLRNCDNIKTLIYYYFLFLNKLLKHLLKMLIFLSVDYIILFCFI